MRNSQRFSQCLWGKNAHASFNEVRWYETIHVPLQRFWFQCLFGSEETGLNRLQLDNGVVACDYLHFWKFCGLPLNKLPRLHWEMSKNGVMHTVDRRNPPNRLRLVVFSHDLPGFIHPNWCRILPSTVFQDWKSAEHFPSQLSSVYGYFFSVLQGCQFPIPNSQHISDQNRCELFSLCAFVVLSGWWLMIGSRPFFEPIRI